MAKALDVLASFNAWIARLRLTRRSRPHMHALYRWVIGARAPARPRQFAYAFVVARRRHR